MDVSVTYLHGYRFRWDRRRRAAERRCVLMMLALLSTLGACCDFGPKRPFPIEALLLEGASFPLQVVEVSDYDPPGPSGSCNRAARAFYTPSDLGHQNVYQYNSARRAARSIAWHESIVFDDRWVKELTTPSELAYRSQEADYMKQQCGLWDGDTQHCMAVVQYEEYVFRLTLSLDPGSLTLAGFEEVVQAMDERAVLYIKQGGGSTTPETTPSD